MKEGQVAEVTSPEEKTGEACSSMRENEQSDGSPWLLEWFPGFDIPIGLEGRAYLRRLLNHRRAENPAACETLLAAHGIKLGRGVPGHTSNWGSMKVRELLHAAFLLGCWSAVERLCINFCHANGLKTEWIRELKAKGGKQSVTLANLQNYRKKNREKKRPQQPDTREKKASVAVAVSASAPVSATASPCAVGAAASISSAPVSLVATGAVPTFCKQVEGDAGDDISCSSVGSEASKKRRRSSTFSCGQRTSCPYVCSLLTSQQAVAESTASPGFEYTCLLPHFRPSDAQNSIPKHDSVAQENTVNISSKQLPLQLRLPLPHNPPSGFAGGTLFPTTDADGVANTDTECFTAAPASRLTEQAPSLTYILENNPTGASSATPSNATPVARMRRPKRRSGKPKPSGPRKRRQISTRKSPTDTRTGSFSSVTSCEYPAAHLTKCVLSQPGGQTQCVDKLSISSDFRFPTGIHHGVAASACDPGGERQSLFSTTSLPGHFCRGAQRAVRPAANAAPPATRPTARSVASVPRDATRQASPRYCHSWFAASFFSTDSSDNGSSETESLYSRTSTCTTTSSYSDSDHSLHEGCRCSFLRAKQVNFAGKKPALTCFSSSCHLAEATPHSLFLNSLAGEEKASASTVDTGEPAWTEVPAAPHVSQVAPRGDLELTRSGHHFQDSYREQMNRAPATTAAIQENFLNPYKNSIPSTSDLWNASPRPAPEISAKEISQEVCPAEAFDGDGHCAVTHSPPQRAASPQFTASSHKGESEQTERAHYAQGESEQTERAHYAQVSPAEREHPFVDWDPRVSQTPPNTDFAAVDADVVALPPLCRAWQGPSRDARDTHLQKETQAQFDEARCTMQGSDASGDIPCVTVQYCNRRSNGISGQVCDKASASEREFRASSESQQLYVSQREQEDKYRHKSTCAPKALAAEKQKAISMNGGEYAGRTRDTSSNLGCAAQTSPVADGDIRIGPRAATCVHPYVGAPLPSPVRCTETLTNSPFSFNNCTQLETQSTTEARELNDRSATRDRTDILYSGAHFHAEEPWIPYFGGGHGECCAWGDNLSTQIVSASAAPSTTPDITTPLLSPRAAALVGGSSAAAMTDPVAGRGTAEMCATSEDDISANQFPLQLPPLAETQDLFLSGNILTTEGCPIQTAVWRESSRSAPEAEIESVPVAGDPRPPAISVAAENSALSPRRPSNTAALSTDWGGVEPTADCCTGEVVLETAESERVTSTLETTYQIPCAHSGNLAQFPTATVQLTVRRLGLQ